MFWNLGVGLFGFLCFWLLGSFCLFVLVVEVLFDCFDVGFLFVRVLGVFRGLFTG